MFAWVWLFSSMVHFVRLKMLTMLKGHIALVTSKWPVSSMNSFVRIEVTLSHKSFIAEVTRKESFSSVKLCVYTKGS